MTDRAEPPPAARRAPADLIAVLASLQDQLDDLFAVVEAQQRRIADLERQLRQQHQPAPSRGR